jgi:hypothetical protein
MAEDDRRGAAGETQVDGALDVEEAGGGEQCHAQMQKDANAEDGEEEEEGPDGEMRFEVLADDAWSVARPPEPAMSAGPDLPRRACPSSILSDR